MQLVDWMKVSKVAMRIIFPLLAAIGCSPDGNALLYPTAYDVVALHINAFAIQSFIDKVLNGKPANVVSPVATLHHQKGLKLLRERLDSTEKAIKISDETISAVLKLASAALFDGDAGLALQHMQGLRKMVDLRGGLCAFVDKPRLLGELWRYLFLHDKIIATPRLTSCFQM